LTGDRVGFQMVRDVAQSNVEQDRLLNVLRDQLYVSVVSDVLDARGLLEQAMDTRLRPLAPGMRLVGRAHTVMTADVYVRPEEPYGPEIEAVDALRPGDVMVASTSHSERTCFWGELLSTAAVARGAAGCAIDGHTRDALRIMDMGFPVFATGFRPVDSSSWSWLPGRSRRGRRQSGRHHLR
jgi:4-hydroxy-4-methyl-2-oxoglutarate aldolase